MDRSDNAPLPMEAVDVDHVINIKAEFENHHSPKVASKDIHRIA